MNLTLNDTPLDPDTSYPLEDLPYLQVNWPADPKAKYTLIVYDTDAWKAPLVNLLIINIPGSNISQGNALIPYFPFGPRNRITTSGTRRYIFDVYRQSQSLPRSNLSHERFPLEQFVSHHRLQLIARERLILNLGQDVFYLEGSPVTVNAQHSFIMANSTLDEREQAFCSCVVQVAAKQPGACNLEKAWFEERNGESCYNPFAVCANSVGTTSRDCWNNYDFDAMSDKELQSLAYLHNKQVPSPYDRDTLIGHLQSK